MSLTNCLGDWCYRKRYYFLRPWRFFQELGQNIHAAWERATKGFAYRDAAEMDEFLLHIIPGMLREIANGPAYPGDEKFPTPESWQDWCNALADVFESVQEENWGEGRNEWESKWREAQWILLPNKNLTMTYTMTEEEAEDIREKYWAREKELWEERETIVRDAYNQLALYHRYLWI